MTRSLATFAFWLTAPTFPHIEIARDAGFTAVVLDIEHGTFNLDDLDRVIPFCRALGMKVYAKVLGPLTEPIQQALDFGADAIIIPHIGDLAHARAVTAATKYPSLGVRSYAGGRTVGYGPAGATYGADENARTACWPMIESRESLADVEAIAQLPTVDGLFAGPTDLSMAAGNLRYTFNDADKLDIARIAAAAKAAGKPWVMPCWTAPERAFAREHGVSVTVVGAQFYMVRAAFASLVDGLAAEGLI
ncbi:aldolase/citrate lyase family protein [Xanthobacter oligotrophicus]|uniref:aldolase/citrate lyase family protein n=1 Tax=Xanthobacter oligotrophicus TaxID=2607286 RepID=UPI00165DB808|nr:aldolase/citrate lyase family protein [Xanthobacter oligotrophicus]MCG5234705.1 aldolase/citrate lyase family protein [Xanthobacter oligotrophicus]